MPNIPPEVIRRISTAISERRCAEAQLILHQFLPGLTRTDQLIEALSNAGDSAEFRSNYERAEEYYSVAISLYENCLPQMHAEGLHCIRRLAEMLRRQQKQDDLNVLLMRAAPLISRITRRQSDRAR